MKNTAKLTVTLRIEEWAVPHYTFTNYKHTPGYV